MSRRLERLAATCLLPSFAVPCLLLVVWPALQAQKIAPQAYVKDRDGIDGAYPGKGIYRSDESGRTRAAVADRT